MYDYKYPVYILEWLPSCMKAGWFSFNNDDYNVDDDIKSDDSARAEWSGSALSPAAPLHRAARRPIVKARARTRATDSPAAALAWASQCQPVQWRRRRDGRWWRRRRGDWRVTVELCRRGAHQRTNECKSLCSRAGLGFVPISWDSALEQAIPRIALTHTNKISSCDPYTLYSEWWD